MTAMTATTSRPVRPVVAVVGRKRKVQRLAKRLEKSKREMNIPTTTDHIAAARLCFQAADELCSDLSDQLAI
jgi:hypothetical protein